MNNLIYSFRDSKVRVLEENGQIWFAAKDVCNVLEIKNTTQAMNRLDSDEVTMFNIGGLSGETNFVNEQGLYNLIFGSRKPEAKEFKRWVTHEVLPSIRKNGAYMTDEVLDKAFNDPDFMIGLLNKLKEEKQARVEAENTVTILTHVNKTYNATEIAKECGFKSAQELNNKLEYMGIQYKSNNTWVLKSKYSSLGYIHLKQRVLDNGKVVYDRKFTQRGREFILKLFEK